MSDEIGDQFERFLAELATLVEVIPVARRIDAGPGRTAAVDVVTIYTHQVVVVTSVAPGTPDEGHDAPDRSPPIIWDLEDDVGTVYTDQGGTVYSGERMDRYVAPYAPAPPADATKLRLVAIIGSDATVGIELGSGTPLH